LNKTDLAMRFMHEDFTSEQAMGNKARWKRCRTAVPKRVGRCVFLLLEREFGPQNKAAARCAGEHILEFAAKRPCECAPGRRGCLLNWPSRVSAMIDLLLCPKAEGAKYHDLKCLNRTCSVCGAAPDGTWLAWKTKVAGCGLLEADMDDASYRSFDSVPHRNEEKAAAGQTQLSLVRRTNESRRLFVASYRKSLCDYIYYRFIGRFMDDQIKPTFGDVPRNKAAMAIDYSEVFGLDPLHQLQSQYFSRRSIRILVVVSVRHAVFEIDGEESASEFIPVFENWFICADGDAVENRAT
jgi:hypothetical protein